jgi:hypothetical protein
LTFNPFGGRGKGRDGLKLGILCPSAWPDLWIRFCHCAAYNWPLPSLKMHGHMNVKFSIQLTIHN